MAVGLIEGAVIAAGGWLGATRSGWFVDMPVPGWSATAAIGLLFGLLYVMSSRSAGLYALPALLEPGRSLRRTLIISGVVFVALTATLHLFKTGPHLPLSSVLGFSASMLAACCAVRVGAAAIGERLIRREALAGRPAYLIGDALELAALTPSVLLREFGVREAGRMVVPDTAPATVLAPQLAAALTEARDRQAREFIVATRWDRRSSLGFIEGALRASPLPVRLVPNAEVRSVLARGDGGLASDGYAVELQRAPMSAAEKLAKRAFDVMVAGVAILTLLPLLVVVAVALKIDSRGPVIFRQRRNGYDRVPFTILKFRTMTVLEDGPVVTQARRGDSRITAVGRFLRRTSIDELPQLFNVLRGEMSLVGPRPHALAHDQQYAALIEDYCIRHHVKPGITGWAQVKGCRGETARPEQMTRRVDHDVWYIQNWSFGLDLHILLRTAIEVARHDAY